MQRIKRPMVWLLLVTLIVSLFPPGLVNKAEAAGAVSDFFFPDNPTLKSTFGMGLKSTDDNKLTNDNALQVTESNLEIKGSYLRVIGSTLRVEVQAISMNTSTSNWENVTNQMNVGSIQRDADSPDNRFKANVQLYPGMNKLTFSGVQGDNSGVTGSNSKNESFYVYFKPTTYINNVNILSTGYQPIPLNEGATVVVPTEIITLEGKVANATRVNVSVNGGSDLPATLQANGQFYSTDLRLKSGINNLILKVTDGSSTVNRPYQLYYYQGGNSIISAQLGTNNNNKIDLLGNDPTWTLGEFVNGNLYLELLLEDDNGKSFKDYGSLTVGGKNLTELAPTITEEVFQGTAGIVPSYRKINITISNFEISEANRSVSVEVRYGGNPTSNRTLSYNFAEGQIRINQIQLLPSSFEPNTVDGISTTDVGGAVALNGSTVSSSSFYILVETRNDIDMNAESLIASYIPTGTVTVEKAGPVTGKSQYVYKVTDFKSGAQNVKFSYGSNSNSVQAKINFVSKTNIYVSSHTNGQVVTVNSSRVDENILTLTGEYIDFPAQIDRSLHVNGHMVKDAGDVWLEPNGDLNSKKFSINLAMADSTDSSIAQDSKVLVFGENNIILKGSGDTYITQLLIYIVDENQPTIKNYMPSSAGSNAPQFPQIFDTNNGGFDENEAANFFNSSVEFNYQGDNTYKTVEKQYSLIFRASGASQFELLEGTRQVIPPTSITATPPVNGISYNGQTLSYEIIGNDKDFIVRVSGFTTPNPGTYSYNLNVYKNTGSFSSGNVTIISEVKPYEFYAPKPTVDGKYVVSKNFIHFDIYAPGATGVVIGKEAAVLNPATGRYELDYVGLKQDKNNEIDVEISTGQTSYTETFNVYYTGAVGVDSQYMPTKTANKYSVFNKSLELSFPKGTILQSETDLGITKYYPDTKILFGIANPENGIVERRNDYGQIVRLPGPTNDAENNLPKVYVTAEELINFQSTDKTRNFALISDVYWINGGLGEVEGTTTKSTNGLAPYSVTGMFNNIENERKVTPSQRGELTLSYDPNVVDEVGSTIAVFRYIPVTQEERLATGDSRPKWERIGGVVDTKGHSITVPFDEFGYYKVMKLSRSYPDITGHNWARNILNAVYSKGYMENLTFEQFGAQDQTTRGEFATLLVKGLNLPLNYKGTLTFTDVYLNSSTIVWDYKHIETAARAGIITGVSEGIFNPDGPLTREQAATMIARATNLKLAANDDKLSENLAKSFIDSGQIDLYARPAVLAVSKAKIMVGAPTSVAGQSKVQYMFNPKSNLTRAEAAKIAVELLKNYTKVFPKNLS